MKYIRDTEVKKMYKQRHLFALYECKFCLKHFEASKHEVKFNRVNHCGCSNWLKDLLPESINGFDIVSDLGIVNGRRNCIAKCIECFNEFQSTVTNIRIKRTSHCGCVVRVKKTKPIKVIKPKQLSIIESVAKLMNTSVKEITLLNYNYKSIKARCYRVNHPKYHRYGGIGIVMCDRWLASFESFVLDMGLKPGDRLSIDRINNYGIYEPSNCKWSTYKEQANNKG